MKMFVITPSGDRFAMEAFTGFSVHKITEGDPGALSTLQHARESSDVTDFPEVVALVDAMLRSPSRALSLVAGTSAINRVCIDRAIALVYCAQNPETGVRAGTGAGPSAPAIH